MRWGEVRRGEVRWGEVRWGEADPHNWLADRARPGPASEHRPLVLKTRTRSGRATGSHGERVWRYYLYCRVLPALGIIVGWPAHHYSHHNLMKGKHALLSYYFIIVKQTGGGVYQERNWSHYMMTITLSIFVQYNNIYLISWPITYISLSNSENNIIFSRNI